MNARSSLGIAILVGLSLTTPNGLLAQDDQAEIIPEWKLIGQVGDARTVYVSRDGLRDKYFVARVLQDIASKTDPAQPVQIMLFDDQGATPHELPMTANQMLHFKAQYNRNPKTGLEKFVWMSVIDAKASPPRLKETEAQIRPGMAK